MHPVLCMITEGRRFGAARETALAERAAIAARGGVHLIQVRERDLEAAALARTVAACLEAVRPTHARVIVNDRLDVALATGAHGVHLRHDSIAARRVRRLAPDGFIVGRSVHSAEEAAHTARDGGVDYLLFGPVFATPSKPTASPAGLDRLAEVVRASSVPVLAVGGMSAGRVHEVMRAGAAGVAAIGLFMSSDVGALPRAVRELVHRSPVSGKDRPAASSED